MKVFLIAIAVSALSVPGFAQTAAPSTAPAPPVAATPAAPAAIPLPKTTRVVLSGDSYFGAMVAREFTAAFPTMKVNTQ